jgi:hypothetical protein
MSIEILDYREFTVNVTGAPAMVTVTLSVQPAGYGTLFLYREDGVVLGGTSGSTTVRIVKGTRGYLVAQAAPGNQLTKITVNGKEYTSPQTPIITFDRDMSATAYFGAAAPPTPSKVNVRMEVRPSGAGKLTLYKWVVIGIPIGDTTSSTTIQVDKGMLGFFRADPASGYRFSKITVNGATYDTFLTPTMTFDKDVTAIAYFESTAPTPPTPPPAGVLKIKEANHPASAQVGQETPFYFTAHVESGSIRDAGLAYIYADGPSDTITIIGVDGKETIVWKGSRTIAYRPGDSPTCTTLDSRGSWRGVKFPAQGRYSIRLAACSNCSGEPKIEDSRDYTVEVSQAPPTAPPEEKKPPEEEKPWWERTYYGLPLWAWIAIGAGGIAAIGAVAYAEEKRREELMFILMGRR